MKICGCCKKEKDNSEFGRNKKLPDGLRWECRECRSKIYYQNHEKMLEVKRLDYEKHKKSRLTKSKEKYQNNPEIFIERSKSYYNNNREIILQKTKQYNQENLEHVRKRKRESEQRSRDKKKAIEKLLESQQITVNYPPNYKICTKCHTLKHESSENFNLVKGKNIEKIRYRAFCKECESISNKRYHIENGDKIRAERRRKHKENPEIAREKHKKARQSEAHKIRHALPENRINRNMSQYIRFALSEVGLKKNGRAAMKYVGCTREFFRNYIRSQFKEGMNWDNYGNGPDQWSVDHFIPKEAFNILNQEEQDICFNYKNCQPMWHLENETKQDKMPDGSFARNTKDNYSLNDKINLIENRLQSLNLSNLV